MADIECRTPNNSPTWGLIDLFAWKLIPDRIGGGRQYIQNFKDAWARHNKQNILEAATKHRLPPPLLAGVCWIEVGGDPNFIDRVAFEVRSFDWSGPPAIDKLGMTRHPKKTSFASVSIQIRTAGETMGIPASDMSVTQSRGLANCLQRDVFNIDVVAQHLWQLADHDQYAFPLDMEQVRVIGARYNRGMGLSLEQIKQNTSYGNFIVNFWPRFSSLME